MDELHNILKTNVMIRRLKRNVRRVEQECYFSFLYIYTQALYLTNRLHFPVCVYCNRSQMTSQRVKNKKYETKSSGVTVVLYTL